MKNDPFIRTYEDGKIIEGTFRIPSKSSIGEYLSWASSFSQETDVDLQERETVANEDPPFLSILMRTQGTRAQEINEVLLCLSSQSDISFEVILLGHNVTEENAYELQGILNEQPAWLRKKINYIPVSGGTRTKPLNEGLRHVNGAYMTILDDDDLVLDSWVKEFHDLSNKDENYGKILHCYALTQRWETAGKSRSNRILRSIESPEPQYCCPFNPAEELFLNHAPTLSLAFPAYVFQNIGVMFNENLTTTEDWDFLMKAYFICGICDAPKPTSIYRLWQNASNSHSLHNREEWIKNYSNTATYLDNIPLLFGPGGRAAIQDQNSGVGTEFSDGMLCNTCELVYNSSSDVSQVEFFEKPKLVDSFTLEYSAKKTPPIRYLTFRPTNRGFFTAFAFKATIIDSENKKYVFDFSNVKTNGQQVDSGHVIFLQRVPEIYFEFQKPINIETVQIYIRAEPGAKSYHIDQAVRGPLSLWAGRTKRWILRRLGLGE